MQEKACVPNLSVQLLAFQRTKGQIKSEWIVYEIINFPKYEPNYLMYLKYIGQKSFKFFGSYFGKWMISYIHSDLIWPLTKTILGGKADEAINWWNSMVCIKYRITKTNHIFHWRITTKLRLQSIGKNPSRQEKKGRANSERGTQKNKKTSEVRGKKKERKKIWTSYTQWLLFGIFVQKVFETNFNFRYK